MRRPPKPKPEMRSASAARSGRAPMGRGCPRRFRAPSDRRMAVLPNATITTPVQICRSAWRRSSRSLPKKRNRQSVRAKSRWRNEKDPCRGNAAAAVRSPQHNNSNGAEGLGEVVDILAELDARQKLGRGSEWGETPCPLPVVRRGAAVDLARHDQPARVAVAFGLPWARTSRWSRSRARSI